MRKASRLHGQKIELLLCINQPGQLAPGHPAGTVMLNEKMANMAIPLFESLDFIGKVNIIDNPIGNFDYDFDKFRTIGLNYTGNISRWYFYTYPELTCDLSEPIYIPTQKEENDIVINRTTRYHGKGWDYLLFREWQDRMTFVGVEQEYNILKAKLPRMAYSPVKDFLELAGVIKGSNLFVGGQSMAFALAEQMKIKRALELCPTAPNVIPTGGEGYDCFTPANLIYVLRNSVLEFTKQPLEFTNAPDKNI